MRWSYFKDRNKLVRLSQSKPVWSSTRTSDHRCRKIAKWCFHALKIILLLGYIPSYLAETSTAETNTDPIMPISQNEVNGTQYLRATKMGKILLSENSIKILTGYNLAGLLKGVLIAKHQTSLVIELFANSRKTSMADRDPFQEKIRTILAAPTGLKANDEDLHYPETQHDSHKTETQGGFDENLAFCQNEAQILESKTERMTRLLQAVLEKLTYVPLKPDQPDSRIDIKPALESLKTHLQSLTLEKFNQENESPKSLGYTEIVSHMAKFTVDIPDSDPKKAKLAEESEAIAKDVPNLGRRLMFVASQGLAIQGAGWDNVGGAAPTSGRKRRQLVVAAISGLIGYLGSSVLSSFQSNSDHEELARIIKAENTNAANQAELSAKVADIATLLEHVDSRQDTLYTMIKTFGKKLYKNIVRQQFLSIATILDGSIDILERELRDVSGALDQISMGQFPSQLLHVEQLRLGVMEGLKRAHEAGYEEITSDLRVLLKSKATLLNADLSLKFIFFYPIQSKLFKSPELVYIEKHQIISEGNLIYELNLPHTLYAIFEKNDLVAEIPPSVFRQCRLFVEQVKQKEVLGAMSQDEYLYLCFRKTPLPKLNFQVFKRNKGHCIKALLQGNSSEVIKKCPLKVLPLKTEKILQKNANNFVSLDFAERKRFQSCFSKNSVTGKITHARSEIYTSISEKFHLPPNCFFYSEDYIAFPAYSGITNIAPQNFEKDTGFNAEDIFRQLKVMEKIDFETQESFAKALRSFSQIQGKQVKLDLKKLTNLKKDLEKFKAPIPIPPPIHGTRVTLAHMILTVIISIMLLTLCFYFLLPRVPRLIATFADQMRGKWRTIRTALRRRSGPDPSEVQTDQETLQNLRQTAAATEAEVDPGVRLQNLNTLAQRVVKLENKYLQLKARIDVLETKTSSL